MRRAPVRHASTPAYPDLVRSPWVLGLIAAGGVALGSAGLGGCRCRTAGEPQPVQEILPTPGEAPHTVPDALPDPEPVAPAANQPDPATIPEASGEEQGIAPPPPAVPAAPTAPPSAPIRGDMPAPEPPVPATP